jgi:hypothetical protein
MAKHAFRVHPKFIYDAFRRQAGSLAKAVLEGVMNAIEAGSEAVHVGLDGTILTIDDTGGGIITKRDIMRYFASVGQPHTADEHKIWAQFRIGRGQLFSFGVNTWLTGTHKLVVDIEQWNIEVDEENCTADFDWIEKQSLVKGCKIAIELYRNPIGNGYSSVDALQEAIKKLVEFVAVPVYFNGTLISTDPAELDWDDEDDYAYYLWARGVNLSVYNLGAHCKDIDASTAGVTGVVVSKRQLKVNFARNDIQYDCPVWKCIQAVIRENRVRRTRTESRGYLQPHERIATLLDLRDGVERFADWKTISLIETSSGRALTLDLIRKNRSPWTFAPQDDEVADKLMQLDRAICINAQILSELSYSGDPADFFVWLTGGDAFKPSSKWFRPFDGYGGLSSSYTRSTYILVQDKWNEAERRIIRVLNKVGGYFNLWRGRHLTVGVSDTYAAWTDGGTYIAMSKTWLKRVATGSERGMVELFSVLTHEMAHDEDTGRTHIHTEEFYRLYHDLSQGRARDVDDDSLTSPLIGINYFRDEMKTARIDEKYDKAQEREVKALELRQKKLGMNKTKVAASTGVKRTPKAKRPASKRQRRCRRLRI